MLEKSSQEAGETLTEALHSLGMAVCTGSLAASAGKALEGWRGGKVDPLKVPMFITDVWYW